MKTVKDNRSGTRDLTRYAGAISFALIVGMGYAVSSHVRGAVDSPVPAEESAMAPQNLPSDCAINGLVFADCYLEL